MDDQNLDPAVRDAIDKLDLHKQWSQLDFDGRGNITKSDVKLLKASKGIDALSYMDKMDYDRDGEVDPQEFAHYIFVNRIGREPTPDELAYAVKMVGIDQRIASFIPALSNKWYYYDIDNSGFITIREIEAGIYRNFTDVNIEKRDKMVTEAAREIMGDLDENSDGRLSKEEFMSNELTRLLHRHATDMEVKYGLAKMNAHISKKKGN